jgi:cellulose synthase/poly-beta-1,6-N-acetylglucosamine synthase-like glycosyltransferase
VLHLAWWIGVWTLIGFVLLGAVPMLVGAYQFVLIGLHGFKNHLGETEPFFPRIAVLVPAWNEAAVIAASIDRLMALDYPMDRLRIYVVDDASTDDTPTIVLAKAAEHPANVMHLRRAKGGEGKAHTLNHGLRIILEDDWMEALLITDADVLYEDTTLRKMARHLADPKVGAVTAYIKEGSQPGNYLTRFIGFEYVTAEAAGRRAQNVLGALACLSGGAQLHSRANLEAIGGRIDVSSLAEDTITTFLTQLRGRRVIFDGDAVAWAEEPEDVGGLWKQRLRWSRGNLQVTRRYRHLWFHHARFGPNPGHRLGGVSFGLIWFSILLQPLLMLLASIGLVVLYFVDFPTSWRVFHSLWIANVVVFVFITTFSFAIDPRTARRSWKEGIAFPGLVSLAIMLYAAFPALYGPPAAAVRTLLHLHPGPGGYHGLILFAYAWLGGSMLVAYGSKTVSGRRGGRFLSPLLVYIGGYGPLLCSVTLASYVYELRHAEAKWDKTEKKGKVAIGV